jgi:hypothetical protein
MSNEKGRFQIAAEKAVADLKLPQEDQEKIWQLLHTQVSGWVRQTYLTADFNVRYRKANNLDKAEPVPDHIQREQARAEANRLRT